MLMNEDSAGNKWYAEFDEHHTAPIRLWVEPPPPAEYVVVTLPEEYPHTLLDA